MRDAWALSQLALLLLQVDPYGLGGVWLKSGYSPARQSWLSQLQSLGLKVMRMPHHIEQERLLGGIDLSMTLAQGRMIEQIGLLAQANDGLLLLPMSEKLSAQTLAMLLQAHDRGELQGLATGAIRASQFGLVAIDESRDDEPGSANKLKERLALWLDLDGVDIATSQEQIDLLSAAELLEVRACLKQIEPTDAQIRSICEVAFALGIDNMRATVFALRLACVHAAIHGQERLEDQDLQIAVQIVLSPRATRLPAEQNPEPENASPPPSDSDSNDTSDSQQDAAPTDNTEPAPPEDTLLAAAVASLPQKLLDQLLMGAAKTRSSNSNGQSGQQQLSRQRGRPLSPRIGQPSSGARLHLLATLRAAAPKQKLRTKHENQAIAIRTEDFYIQRFAHKAASCIIVALDASGSAALARLAEAKGAVEILVQQSYARRDSVCVIGFRGAQAQTLLPATRSLVRAKKALAGLPGGGGTPIAIALRHAIEQAQSIKRQGMTPLLVILSDGKANVTIDGVGGRSQAGLDALQWANQWARLGFSSLWIDTSLQPGAQAQALANAMQGRYLPMPYVASQRLADAIQLSRSDLSGAV